MSLLKPVKWHPLVPTHITQNSYIHGQTHQPVMWWITADCLLATGICNHLKLTQALMDVWQASETNHSKSISGNFQHQYLPKLLINVYIYYLMVKSMSCCCVCVRQLFSNSVTYVFLKFDNLCNLLNQAHTWFLNIDPVRIIGMHACMCVYVCVCPCPRLLITSGVM